MSKMIFILKLGFYVPALPKKVVVLFSGVGVSALTLFLDLIWLKLGEYKCSRTTMLCNTY